VLCLWRMAERGNRGAARELERAAKELGGSRVGGFSAGREKTRAKPACVSGEAAIREQRSNSTLPNSLAAPSNSLAAPRFPLSANRHKQSTGTRSRIPPATLANARTEPRSHAYAPIRKHTLTRAFSSPLIYSKWPPKFKLTLQI